MLRSGSLAIWMTVPLAVAALTACSAASDGSSSGDSSGSSKAIKTLTFVNPLPSYAGWNTAQKCMEAQGKAKGIDVTSVGPSGASVNNAKAVEDILRAASTGQDAIAMVPIDETFQAAIDQARDKGVYVAAVDSLGAAKNLSADVGVDLETIGKTLVENVGKTNPKARFATLSINPSSLQAKEFEGMKKAMGASYPDMKIVTDLYDDGDFTKDVDLVRAMLVANPDVDFIFSANGASTSAVVTAIKEAGRAGKVNVIVNDLTPESADGLRNGTIWGVNDQAWCEMGRKTVDALKDISAGKLSSEETFSYDAGVNFVTKDNVEEALANPA